MREWISPVLFIFFPIHLCYNAYDRILYRNVDPPVGSPFNVPALGRARIDIEITIQFSTRRMRSRNIQFQFYAVNRDYDVSDAGISLYKLSDSITVLAVKPTEQDTGRYNTFFWCHRFQGVVLPVFDEYYQTPINITQHKTKRECQDFDGHHVCISYHARCRIGYGGNYCHRECLEDHPERGCLNTYECPDGQGSVDVPVSIRFYEGKRLSNQELERFYIRTCNLQLLCTKNACPNNDCFQHSPTRYFCESWFTAITVQSKSVYYMGEFVGCDLKIKPGILIPVDLPLEVRIEKNWYLEIDPNLPHVGRIIKGPGETDITCITRVSKRDIKKVVHISIKFGVPPCHVYPFTDSGIEIQVFDSYSPLQFRSNPENPDEVIMSLFLKYSPDRTGVFVDQTTVNFDNDAKPGLYIISCNTRLRNTNFSVTVDHPILLSRPPLPAAAYSGATAQKKTPKRKGEATYADVNIDDVEADSSLQCTSDAYPVVLSMKMWKITIGSDIHDQIYTEELNLENYLIKPGSTIEVDCTVMYFTEHEIRNYTSTFTIKVKKIGGSLMSLDYSSVKMDFGDIYLICFSCCILLPLLVILLGMFWFSCFQNTDEKMALNCQFYVKYPRAIRNLRDSPLTDNLKAKMQSDIHGAAYYRNWRLSQEILLQGNGEEEEIDDSLKEEQQTNRTSLINSIAITTSSVDE